jgi:TolB-like protein/Tfp pilus assembly protein PilF
VTALKQQATFYEFGPFRLYPLDRRLLKNGNPVHIQLKTVEVLLFLVENRGRVAGRNELLHKFWQPNISPGVLAYQIGKMREVLGDDATDSKYVRTEPKRGYSFIAEVRSVDAMNSLAVLPFRYVGQDPDGAHWGLGIADALITKLTNLKHIIVRPTSAVHKYMTAEVAPIEVGRELEVEWILQGTLRSAGTRVRATCQLINVQDRSPLWADKIDEQFSDVFSMEDTISTRVADSLISRLTQEERNRLLKRHTEDPAAHELYLKGRFFWLKASPGDVRKALDFFEKAVELDGRYGLAYAGMADSWVLLGTFAHQTEPAHRTMREAEAAATRALEIDESIAAAHYALASVKALYWWDWAAASPEFQRAIQLNPTSGLVRLWYSLCLAARGEHKSAWNEISQAISYDPTSFLFHSIAVRVLYLAGRYDDGIKQAQQALEYEPYFYLAHTFVGHIYRAQEDFDRALAEFHMSDELSNHNPVMLGDIGITHAVMGRTDEARDMIERLQDASVSQYVSPCLIANIYAALKDNDKAFEFLEKTFDERAAWLIFLTRDPVYDLIRKDARFAALVRRVGFFS